MEVVMMSGDEAVARGAYEAGCTIAAAYPGTPSTEILENIAKYKETIYCQWACNEKVAVEIVAGASITGSRALAAMKHVGMNVATDPIFSMGYAGVTGGMVIVCADDPGCHSSQNEQDNRLYAPHAKLCMLEPSDSQECKDYAIAAFDLSEKFDVPCLLRMTTRVCHSKSCVTLGERQNIQVRPYHRQCDKFAMLPATARKRHLEREQQLLELEEYANHCSFNREESTGKSLGIITSGISYQYAREVFGDSADYLKLGLTYPLPRNMITSFCTGHKTIYVIEENEPYLENMVHQLGFICTGKDKLPICNELNPGIVRECLTGKSTHEVYTIDVKVPNRAPTLCAGCPHRGFFYTISRNLDKVLPAGDIGCYALGVGEPFNGFEYSICMGAGLSSIIGASKSLAAKNDGRKMLGMVGDSTFYHSGLNSLIDVITSKANVIACILDNSITAMTGHQDNPGTMHNMMGEETEPIDLVQVIKALGVKDEQLRVVDPLSLKDMQQAITDGVAYDGPFIIVTRRPCVLIKEIARKNAGRYCTINKEKCIGCKQCMKVSCPAIALVDGKPSIVDPEACTACGLCAQMCIFGAIAEGEQA